MAHFGKRGSCELSYSTEAATVFQVELLTFHYKAIGRTCRTKIVLFLFTIPVTVLPFLRLAMLTLSPMMETPPLLIRRDIL
jgi:hypothetical protein